MVETNMKQEEKKMGTGGKIGLSLFFSIFFFAGLLFTIFILKSACDIILTFKWKETPCRVISSEVREDEDGYRFLVKYTYNFNGTDYTSEVYSLNYSSSESYNKSEKLAERYRQDSDSVCYVNPSDPEKAILFHEKPWMILFVILTLIFVLIGGGGIWGIWFYKEKKTAIKSEPLSKKTVSSTRPVEIIFFGVFFLVGCLIFYFLFFKPLVKIIESGSWEKVPATVISGTIREHDGDDGTSYSADILYSYKIDGKEYKSNQYSFMSVSGSYEGARKKLDNYPPGKEFFCYVNPKDPGDSVISRKFPTLMYFGIIPLAFIFVGLAGMMGRFSKKVEPLKYTPGMYERNLILKSPASPLARFMGTLIFSLVWNGFVYFMVSHVISGYRTGNPETCLTIFSIPFALVGLGTLVGSIYYFLTIFNPRPVLILSSNPLSPGNTSDIKWDMAGNSDVIRKFYIYLEGREEATYRQGTSTYTDKEKFLTLNIFETTDPRRMVSGRAGFKIPEDTIHSFKSENNKIIWHLCVIGEIKWWPDIKEEFEVTVLPEEVVKGGAI